MKFMYSAKQMKLQVPSMAGLVEVVANVYPEGIAVFGLDDIYYAVETTTGVAFYCMQSVFDLAATLRAPENDLAIRETLDKIRSVYPAANI